MHNLKACLAWRRWAFGILLTSCSERSIHFWFDMALRWNASSKRVGKQNALCASLLFRVTGQHAQSEGLSGANQDHRLLRATFTSIRIRVVAGDRVVINAHGNRDCLTQTSRPLYP